MRRLRRDNEEHRQPRESYREYQTSGQPLTLMSDHVSKPFLQVTYQGPMP